MYFKDLKIGDKLYSSDGSNILIAELVDKHPYMCSEDGTMNAYDYTIRYNNKEVINRWKHIDKQSAAEFAEGLGLSTWFASKEDYMHYLKREIRYEQYLLDKYNSLLNQLEKDKNENLESNIH